MTSDQKDSRSGSPAANDNPPKPRRAGVFLAAIGATLGAATFALIRLRLAPKDTNTAGAVREQAPTPITTPVADFEVA